MKIVHEKVKDHLEKLITKYKERAYQRKKEIHFKLFDLVMEFLNKDRLPKGLGNKLKMKMIDPCKISNKNGNSVYELELP